MHLRAGLISWQQAAVASPNPHEDPLLQTERENSSLSYKEILSNTGLLTRIPGAPGFCALHLLAAHNLAQELHCRQGNSPLPPQTPGALRSKRPLYVPHTITYSPRLQP